MISELLNNVGRFVFFVLLQVLVLNNIHLFDGLMVPYLYPIIILMLPLNMAKWAVMLVALGVGLSVDSFSNTLGMHASAAVMIGYLRGILLKWIAPRDGYDAGLKPTLHMMGFSWFFTYTGVLVFIHHLWFFNLEHFQFDYFFRTQVRALFSTIFTLFLIFTGQYLSSRAGSKK